jgi:hypothetical protein
MGADALILWRGFQEKDTTMANPNQNQNDPNKPGQQQQGNPRPDQGGQNKPGQQQQQDPNKPGQQGGFNR